MKRKSTTLTRAEARELRQRNQRMIREGGVPHARVVSDMLEDMDRELRQMVRAYRHPSARLKEILECAALAHREGLDVSEALSELLGKIAAGAHPRAA